MTAAGRAGQVQKSKGCPICVSCNHGRDSCKMPANSCNKDLAGGVICKGDHSKLLCGSGNPYSAAANVHRNDEFEGIDKAAETMILMVYLPCKSVTQSIDH